MKTDLFDFVLPEAAIALRPARPRDSARMLCVSPDGFMQDWHVFDLPRLLRSGDVLVLNETRVLSAALSAVRPAREHGGGADVTVDINLHKRLSDQSWRAFARPAKRLKVGDRLIFSERLTAQVQRKGEGGDITLSFNQSGSILDQAIEACGAPPLPPYIARKRAPDAQDTQDYQTVYAAETGSVAAPTAGLHFTQDVFEALQQIGVQIERLTLHVGAGTFLPVKTDTINDHHMHSEWYDITPDTAARIHQAKCEGRRIIAVGTTALRALESAAVDGHLQHLCQETDIFITPGYKFQIIDGVMTNFHLPRSTLFMLVCALCGRTRMQTAYRHAIDSGYRFYSYGDSSLLWRSEHAETEA